MHLLKLGYLGVLTIFTDDTILETISSKGFNVFFIVKISKRLSVSDLITI